MALSKAAAPAGSLTLVLNYDCANDCVFCFTGPERKRGCRGLSASGIERVFSFNSRRRAFRELVLSGEPTLRPDLPAIVRAALGRGGFGKVTLQTNARRLASPRLCAELAASGISEALVSVHAAVPSTNREITGSAAGLAQTRSGIRNLLRAGVRVVSNTVVCAQNYAELPAVALRLRADGVRRSVFWAFLDNGVKGQRACHVRFSECMPPLLEAVRCLKAGGAKVSLSGFPRCLLGSARGLLREYSEGAVVAESSFKRRMAREKAAVCLYPGCSWLRRGCPGFRRRYVAAFGYEPERLRPFPSSLAGRPVK
jgi:MoaA/NifB/PqqE/SkfB family radical SAM enzyme